MGFSREASDVFIIDSYLVGFCFVFTCWLPGSGVFCCLEAAKAGKHEGRQSELQGKVGEDFRGLQFPDLT